MLAPDVPLFDKVPLQPALLWRYLSFAQLTSLLRHGLFCTRVDTFKDKLEGNWPRADVEYWRNPQNGASLAGLSQIKRHAVATCWIEEQNESAAMWSAYGRTSESVAVVTTFGKLSSLLATKRDPQEEWSAGSVRYINFGREGLMSSPAPDGYRHSIFKVLTLKHASYRYEQEVRAIGLRLGSEMPKEGIRIALDAPAFVDRIVTNPLAKDWFVDAVREALEPFSLSQRLSRSEIFDLERELG